mgnify:CR=1 FL=1
MKTIVIAGFIGFFAGFVVAMLSIPAIIDQVDSHPPAVMAVELERAWRIDLSGLSGDERSLRLACKRVKPKP